MSGPKIEPCATPASAKDHFDDWPLRTTLWCMLSKMTVLSCSIYQIFLKALFFKEGYHVSSIKGFKYVQKNTSYFKWGIVVKWFVNFTCYWKKLMDTWIRRTEAWLIVIKEYVILEIFKNRVKDFFFKTFATNRQQWHCSVFFLLFFVTFFMNWDKICRFPFL